MPSSICDSYLNRGFNFPLLYIYLYIKVDVRLSPVVLQLVRSNSRRFMPSQADEEAHQLSYLQKHMANILALLAEPVEGEDDESLVGTFRIRNFFF